MSDRTDLDPEKSAFVAAPDQPARRRRDGRFAKGASGNPRGAFTKGVSGNPAGRPKGSRTEINRLLDDIAAGDVAEVLAKTIEMAKDGDVAAARLILRRSWSVPKGRPAEGLNLPAITTARDAVTAMGAIMGAVSAGTISIDEARDLSGVVDTFRKIHELADIEARIVVLERAARARQRAQGAGTGY